MKERLDELTLQEIIELSCGDYSVILQGDEIPTEAESAARAMRILAEYKTIASPVQAKMDLAENEKLSKLRIKDKCARIAMALCTSGHADLAREILLELGVNAEHLKTDDAILARCQSILGEVQYETDRIAEYEAKRAERRKSPEALRQSWYSEIAGVMSILKVPIDMRLNAAIYANLVHQAVERNKALSKMPPMAGLFM